MASIDISSFMNAFNRKVEPHVQVHLKHVYSCLAICMLSASAGGYVHLFTNLFQGGFLSMLVAAGFALALFATPDNGKNHKTRIGYLTGFSFASGLGLGPFLEYAMIVEPSLIPTAFLSTCLIFGCFSLGAMFSDQRKWMFLGGTLMSLLSMLFFMSIVNLFIGSRLLYQVHLYLGFFLVCGFVIYDTNVIILKRQRGDTDYIWHSVLLFVDFIDMFRYLLIILTQKEQSKQKKRRD